MVRKWNVKIPQLSGETERRTYIYLPDSYSKMPQRRYPVMYMFDGHNVFFDADATYGKSWGMGKYMHKAKKQMIIVAVECNHKGNGRLQEYSPITFDSEGLGKIPGRGRTYMQWLVETLKPYIDETYRTLPDRCNTYLCGSSMGGLMALYGVTVFNHVFQRAACLSPSLWVNPAQVLEMVEKSTIRPNTCVYMDYGSLELDNHAGNMEILRSVANMLLIKGVLLTFRLVPGGSHSEASWEKQVPVFMECLGIKGDR